jgi:glycine cleavage system H protein
MVPKDCRFTNEHEWIRVESNAAYIGVTHYAQDQLGEIVFVELPETGTRVDHMAKFGVVESVKTVSDLFSPVSGEILEVNRSLLDKIEGADNPDFHPEYINEDPYGKGWIIKVSLDVPAQLDSLLTPDDYAALVGEEVAS